MPEPESLSKPVTTCPIADKLRHSIMAPVVKMTK